MRSREPGKIRERLWYLGREESGVYLLEGSACSVIVSGGMSYLVPDILQQIADFNIDEERIGKLLILHSHYDHVGIVPFFKRRHPKLQIYASSRAWEILHMPNAIETINSFSRRGAEWIGRLADCSNLDLEWRDDTQGVSIWEGDQISLGDLGVQMIETPGHSSCSVTAYVPELKALFPSDAGGIPFRDMIMTIGNSNYTQYQQSLEKMKNLDIHYYGADHYGYVMGEEAGDFVPKVIEAAKEYRAHLEKTYLRTRDIETAAEELSTSLYAQYPDYVLPEEIFKGVFRQMLKHIAQALG